MKLWQYIYITLLSLVGGIAITISLKIIAPDLYSIVGSVFTIMLLMYFNLKWEILDIQKMMIKRARMVRRK